MSNFCQKIYKNLYLFLNSFQKKKKKKKQQHYPLRNLDLKLHIKKVINLKGMLFKQEIASISAYNYDPLHGCQIIMGFLLTPT